MLSIPTYVHMLLALLVWFLRVLLHVLGFEALRCGVAHYTMSATLSSTPAHMEFTGVQGFALMLRTFSRRSSSMLMSIGIQTQGPLLI